MGKHTKNIWKGPYGSRQGAEVRQQATDWLCTVMSGVSTDCYRQLSEILEGGKSCKQQQETRYYPT